MTDVATPLSQPLARPLPARNRGTNPCYAPGPLLASKPGLLLVSGQVFGMIAHVTQKFPNVKLVATTLREGASTNRHTWGAVVWANGKNYVSPTCELDVLDRVGGGDGFASGLIYGLLSGESIEESLKLGWAHGALLTTTPGDTTMVTLEQVKSFAKGGSARIQR
jgi:2-dehydro-3-deoxygluconokinase